MATTLLASFPSQIMTFAPPNVAINNNGCRDNNPSSSCSSPQRMGDHAVTTSAPKLQLMSESTSTSSKKSGFRLGSALFARGPGRPRKAAAAVEEEEAEEEDDDLEYEDEDEDAEEGKITCIHDLCNHLIIPCYVH